MARRAARGPPGAGNKFGDGLKYGRRWLSWFRLLAPDQGCIVGDLVGPSVGDWVGRGDGRCVGDLVGDGVGRGDGRLVGDFVGEGVGRLVGALAGGQGGQPGVPQPPPHSEAVGASVDVGASVGAIVGSQATPQTAQESMQQSEYPMQNSSHQQPESACSPQLPSHESPGGISAVGAAVAASSSMKTSSPESFSSSVGTGDGEPVGEAVVMPVARLVGEGVAAVSSPGESVLNFSWSSSPVLPGRGEGAAEESSLSSYGGSSMSTPGSSSD